MSDMGSEAAERVKSILEEYGIEAYVLAMDLKKESTHDVVTFMKTKEYGNAIILVSYLICSVMKKHGFGLKKIIQDVSECFEKLIFRGEE